MDVVVSRSEINGVAVPPPSKSYTHRALIAASLSGRARVFNPLFSEDTIATMRACRNMGARIERKRDFLLIEGCDVRGGYYYFANSGTTLRIFIALLAMTGDTSTLDGDASLRRRPNRELAIAVEKLGGRVWGRGGYEAPLRVRGIMKGGEVELKAMSSQFVTALLFALPLAKFESKIVANVTSKPYIDVTLHVLEESGVRVWSEDAYYVEPSDFRLRKFRVPVDFSSASYLIAAGLLAGEVRILNAYDTFQGDKKIVDVARQMGGDVRWNREEGVIVARRSELEGVEFDARETPDLVPTVAVLAAAAKGVSVIRNAEHLRIKESDRIATICRNLRALGFEVEEYADGMKIVGRSGNFSGTVDSFGDHRIAMSFSLLGLLGKIKVRGAECVSVSFPGFFEVLRSLGARVSRA
ncbi:MAG: 3-phosphoshikimate 1-carboxyvinyltransferase [Archaeoglobaceae archaeon]